MAFTREFCIECGGVGAKGRIQPHILGRHLAEQYIFQHQRGGESAFVIAVGGRCRHRSRHRALGID